MCEAPGERFISEYALTASTRMVLDSAKAEARALNHRYVGTEHILLGLSREADGPAGSLLSTRVSLEALRTQVEKFISRGESTPDGPLPFTFRAAKVLDLARREAEMLGQSNITPEHLLLGILREGTGVATQVLIRLHIDLRTVQAEVSRSLGRPERSAGSPPPEEKSQA